MFGADGYAEIAGQFDAVRADLETLAGTELNEAEVMLLAKGVELGPVDTTKR